ncbi:MAG: tetratricopeptide repeat protein [Myxococcales bacterium]|nr:tetratricopeptide repeat protein [Myxococcales bacterium]
MRRLLMTTLIGLVVFAKSTDIQADRATARELTRLGVVWASRGDAAEALRYYQRAIASDHDYARSYELALPLWLQSGEESRARKELENLTLRCPKCAFAWYALGTLYRRAQRFDLSVLAYEAYLGRRPGDPDAVFGMAMALVALKDPRAHATLERYVALEKRPERSKYRERVLHLIDLERARAGKLPTPLQRLLPYIEPLRPWIAILWRRTSDGDANRGSQ